jgi:hypothetical protein
MKRGPVTLSELTSGSLTSVCGLKLWLVKIRLIMMTLATISGSANANAKTQGPTSSAKPTQSAMASAVSPSASACSRRLSIFRERASSSMCALCTVKPMTRLTKQPISLPRPIAPCVMARTSQLSSYSTSVG